MYEVNIKLGSLAKDRITGFEGIVTAFTVWLNGCVRIGIQPQTLKDGKTIEAEWFDQNQVEVIEEDAYNKKPEKVRGGPMPDPKRVDAPKMR